MPPKAKIPAPIDRPLSRAYVREFKGWSTAEPPGLSDPTTLRIMENVMVNRDGSCRVRPGLRYLSYSQAPFQPIPVPQVTPQYVGATGIEVRQWGPTEAIAMPAGVQEGDLLVLGLISGPGITSACSDPRMTQVQVGTLADGRGTGVWCGYATDLATPIAIFAQAVDSPTGQYGAASLSAFRGVEGPLEWAPAEVEITPVSASTVSELPGLDGPDLSGAICVYLTQAGIGGVYGGQDWSKAPAYTFRTAVPDSNYIEIDVATTTTTPVPAQTTPNTYTDASWYAVVIGYQGDSSLAYTEFPGGVGATHELVGTIEPFYLADGTKAHLVAVREDDGSVGFRAMVLDSNDSAMYALDDPLIGFDIRQPLEVLNFSGDTTYVKYLQIDNKVFALSDNGEPMRVFTVGAHKEAKALSSIERPEWDNDDKLDVVHPDAQWITDGDPTGKRRNRIPNPSFERSYEFWNKGELTLWNRPATPAITPFSGDRALRVESKPTRTNLVAQPLHDVATLGVVGWNPVGTWIPSGPAEVQVEPTVVADGTFLKVEIPAYRATFYARSKLMAGIEGGEHYRVAFDPDQGAHVNQKCRVKFYGITASQVGEDIDFDLPAGTARWISGRFRAPKGAVSARLYVGGENTQASATSVSLKNVVFIPAGEGTAMFHGGSGANYFWTGPANNSASVYHPPADVEVWTDRVPARPGKAHSASAYVQAETTARNVTLDLRLQDKNTAVQSIPTATLADTVGAPVRIDAGTVAAADNVTLASVKLTIAAVPRGEYHWIDAVMLESGVSVPGDYFDGSTADTATARNSWKDKKHASGSLQETFAVGATIPPAETRTPDTLLSNGGRAVNVYSFGFFYTFSNEVGESAASKITVRRAQRAWSDWAWETPNLAGEPSGTNTNNPNKCADQLVAFMPEEVFDEAVAQGATSWSLYMFTWSEQDAAPVTALKVGEKEIPSVPLYGTHGWIRVTPSMADAVDDAILPSKDNRFNYSDPSRAGQGLVVSDRMVLVNDPTDAAVIKWSSNRVGEYTNFTANKGGGYKTLTSGNLFVPAAVKLWQNPQSADTITILCLGTDGESTSYYMAPAQVASQSEAVNIMSFEETTATPGTTSPYGVEVFNNSLYHPLDDQLMKSTASNYNINHKSQTDQIRDMWEKLATKYWIMSSQHDGRLYFIVNNPDGEQVEPGCKGNEIWVLDATAKTGTWSRLLIHAQALKKIEFGEQIFMAVIRPDGVYYLDPAYGLDDWSAETTFAITTRAIPWKLEFNTQGANRAHDAWCHLQLASIQLGYFQGRMRYGLRSVDIHGKAIDVSKVFRDTDAPDRLAFDVEDQLLIRRDLKEWFFYAESLTDDNGDVEPSFGQLSLVQYRYTPSSVNTGYEHGSIETFEYGRDVAMAASSTTANGIPLPVLDSRRP